MSKVKFKKRQFTEGTPGCRVDNNFIHKGFFNAWSTGGVDGEVYPVAIVVDLEGMVHIVDTEHLKFEDW